MHSTASDGGYSPAELVQKCANQGLEIIALTDHDTMNGVEEAIEAGNKLGVKIIPGIEFSTKSHGKSIHMLGYGLDYHDEKLNNFLSLQRQMRRERLDKIIERLNKVNIDLSPEQVLEFVDGGSIGRPHIAKALLKYGYVKDVQEAFNRYLAEGMPCYVGKEKEMAPEEAIKWIHQTNGVAVLAHPVYYDLDSEIERWVVEHQLDGVEVYHRDHEAVHIENYKQIVHQIEHKHDRRLIQTGGSDFHHEDYGRKKEPLGVTRIENYLGLELIKAIADKQDKKAD